MQIRALATLVASPFPSGAVPAIRSAIPWALALLGLLNGGAQAEVLSADAAAFSLEGKRTVAATAAEAWARFVDVASWWDPDHTWSGDAANLRIAAEAGGCFCETLAEGGSVEHMRVVYVAPGQTLRMVGGLGPLQEIAATGSMTVTFTPEESGCTVALVYRVAGHVEGGLQGWAAPVDGVLAGQLDRFAAALGESGPSR